MVLGAGIIGLLLPWVLAPVMGDERYHYVAAPVRMDDNLLNVLRYAYYDIERRLAQGRISPIGVLAQQVGYLLGMQFAFSTGTPIFVVNGIIKLLLLLAVVASFALFLTQLRRRDGEPVDRGIRRTAVLVFAVLLVLGVSTSSPVRNGWTAYIVLCIGGIVLMFLVGAASLWALRVWAGTNLWGRLGLVAALFLLGAVIMLSYELHWAAVPFAVVLLAFAGRASWSARLPLIASIGIGWLISVVWTRAIIAQAGGGTYVGLEMDLGGPVLGTTSLQLANAIPGTGIPLARVSLGEGLPAPHPFGGSGWLWGLMTAVGFLLLFARRADAATDHEPTALDRRALVAPAAALVASALAVAVITSVSVQVHEIVRSFGDTYRSTPWIWACGAGALTLGVLSVPSTRARHLAVAVTPLVLSLWVGVMVWPTSVSAVQTQRAVDQYALWESAQAQLVAGSAGSRAEERRCELARQWKKMAGGSTYFAMFMPHYERSFSHQWNRPWCASSTPAGD
jgi:hypothetical protein